MKIITFFFTILLLSSCSTNKTKNIDLKEYFWKIADYETPKVLVYNYDSIGTISLNYYLIKKVSENELSLTRFDKNFNETQYLNDLFKTEGVYLIETYFVEDIKTKLITKPKITSGFLYPFNDFNAKTYVETSFDLQLNNNINIVNRDSWTFEQVEDKNINGKNVNTIIAKGLTKRIITEKSTGQKHTFEVKLETWYSKGIGITFMKQETPIGVFTDTYVKTITIDEFNEMKK